MSKHVQIRKERWNPASQVYERDPATSLQTRRSVVIVDLLLAVAAGVGDPASSTEIDTPDKADAWPATTGAATASLVTAKPCFGVEA